MNPGDRQRAKIEATRRKSGQRLDEELRKIEPFVDPVPSFARGVQVGGFLVGCFNLFAPGVFGVEDWPQSVRMLLGFAFLAAALHFLIRQIGFMKAQRMNRSVRP